MSSAVKKGRGARLYIGTSEGEWVHVADVTSVGIGFGHGEYVKGRVHRQRPSRGWRRHVRRMKQGSRN